MNRRGDGTRVWALATIGGVAVTALVILIFRSPTTEMPKPAIARAAGAATIELARLGEGEENALLKEEAMMRDPTPLYLPTRWNVAENALPKDFRREFGTSFQGYPPKLAYTGAGLRLNLPPPVIVPSGPAEAFATDKPVRPFFGFGQTDQVLPTVPPRGAFVQVTSVANGQSIIAEPLQDAHPPNDAVWQPMEFLVAVNRTGVVRPPVLTESSRVAAVDGYFVDYLVNGLHIGERLAPGFYRVAIGP